MTLVYLHPVPANSSTADDTASVCPEPGAEGAYSGDEVDGASAIECDLVGELVVSPSGSLIVPEVGGATGLVDIYETEMENAFTLAVTASGTVDAVENPTAGISPDPEVDACTDTTNNPRSNKWYTTSNWRINRNSIPTPNLDADNAIASIREAIQNITNADNTCNMADNVSATGNYLGDTANTSTVGYNSLEQSTCGAGNGASTVHFGDRQPKVLATTCWYVEAHANLNEVVEADIEVDSSDRRWTTVGGQHQLRFRVRPGVNPDA